jgi:hypothetical protein
VAQPSQKSEAKLFQKRNEIHLLKKAKTNCLKKETKPKNCKGLSLKKSEVKLFPKRNKTQKTQRVSLHKK